MKSILFFKTLFRLAPALGLLGVGTALQAADAANPTINVDQVKGQSSPILYGLMTEEINYSYEGGLYAELLQNRTFHDTYPTEPDAPAHWGLSLENNARGNISVDKNTPFNDVLKSSLKFEITATGTSQRVSLSNDGFWGMAVRPSTTYHASFYAKAAPGFKGSLTLALANNDSQKIAAAAVVPAITADWKKYDVDLTTDANITPTKNNRFIIWTTAAGTLWLQNVSLFPPTYKNRANGLRADIMQLMADYHPGFLRFPGGNYLEGNTLDTRFDWKKTVGEVTKRPGHMDDAWNYYSTDGMGLLEFLEWCEDLNMQPVLAVYAGLALRAGEVAGPGEALQPYVQDALDEIEYVTGDVNTTWGAQRAKDGHPAPFKLTYVEIGNEDWRGDYNGRFSQIYRAIKAKYPDLQCIDASVHSPSNGKLTSRVTDVVANVQDSHLYTNSEQQSEFSSTAYDEYDRKGPKVFEGEWATRVGAPTPNFTGALGDAAYMTGLERNADIVIMASYAPLFVNVSNAVGRGPGSSMQWPTDLIGYDALGSYGSPAYYAQVMFNNNRGDQILTTAAENVGVRDYAAPGNRGAPAPGPARQIPTLYYVATRDSKTGMVYFKIVNPLATAQTIHINLKGAASVASNGESVIMKADNLTDTNSITEPKKIMPVTAKESGFGASFDRTLAPYSINIFKISTH